MLKYVNVFETVNKINSTNGNDMFNDYKFVYRNKGIARDACLTAGDEVRSSKLYYTEDEKHLTKVKGIVVYRCYNIEHDVKSDWYFNKDIAIESFLDKYENMGITLDYKIQECFLNVSYRRKNKYPMLVNIEYVDGHEDGPLVTKINMHPELNGYKYAPMKIFFMDKFWTDVCEGPAMVTISKNFKHSGLVIGSMLKFDTVSEDKLGLLRLVKNSYIKQDIDLVFKVKHPIRGEYFCYEDKKTSEFVLICYLDEKHIRVDNKYSKIIYKDMEKYGYDVISLYK